MLVVPITLLSIAVYFVPRLAYFVWFLYMYMLFFGHVMVRDHIQLQKTHNLVNSRRNQVILRITNKSILLPHYIRSNHSSDWYMCATVQILWQNCFFNSEKESLHVNQELCTHLTREDKIADVAISCIFI